MNEKLKDAVQKVYEEISKIPTKKFLKQLEEHQPGDFAKILLECKYFDVGEFEAKAFDTRQLKSKSHKCLDYQI